LVEIITLQSSATTWQELFNEVAEYALKNNLVKNGYKEFLISREKEYPTGLKYNDSFAIALPHADIKYSNRQCIILVKPANKITFNRMDDKNSTVDVDLVAFLIITDADTYSKFLSKLVTYFQDQNVQNLIKLGKLDIIANELRKL